MHILNRHKLFTLIGMALALVSIVLACTPAATPTSTPTATAVPTPTATATATPTPTATAAPVPTAVPGPQSMPGPLTFEVEGQADRSVYVHGERVSIHMTFTNVSGQTLVVEDFPGTVTLDMVDTPPDEGIALASAHERRVFTPGEAATVQLEVPAEVSATLRPGRYTVHADMRLTNGNRMGFGLGVIFALLPPQGALEKTVAVGEERQVGGVAMTLERLQFMADKTTVVVLAVPAGYQPTAVLAPVGAPHPAVDRYRIDGGPWEAIPGGGNRETPNGVHLEWELSPVPSDAVTFEFAVTSFDIDPSHRVSGPWEWTVSLQTGQ